MASPSTSRVHRALRVSHNVLLFPVVQRPSHIPAREDAKANWLCWPAGTALARYVPPTWKPPYEPGMARRHLLLWMQELAEIIEDSTRGHYSLQLLAEADDTIVDEMQAWLDGDWSTLAGLTELLWRLDLGERTISAAMWLHCTGDDGTGRRRKHGS